MNFIKYLIFFSKILFKLNTFLRIIIKQTLDIYYEKQFFLYVIYYEKKYKKNQI